MLAYLMKEARLISECSAANIASLWVVETINNVMH
jgi:hypothetical protein